jgi:hypothetical protein
MADAQEADRLGRDHRGEPRILRERKADLEALGADAPDGDILGARVADEGVKFALIAEEPQVFFTTPHFDGYPMVLVRLADIGAAELTELVTDAWLAQAPKTLVRTFLAERA